MTRNHSLMEQLTEWFFALDYTKIEEHHVPESCVEQMQNRVLVASDIEIHAALTHPVILCSIPNELIFILVITVPQVIPTTSRPSRHGVGFAGHFLIRMQPVHTRFTRGGVHPVRCFGKQWLRCVRFHRLIIRQRRQSHRQRILTHTMMVPTLIKHDRERLAPIPLTREQPITKLKVHPFRTDMLFAHPINTLGLCFIDHQPIEHPRVHRGSITCVCFAVKVCRRGHRPHDRKIELLCKVPVALILSGDRHDRACAIAHHHIIRGPHRDQFIGQRVADMNTKEDTRLLFVLLAFNI